MVEHTDETCGHDTTWAWGPRALDCRDTQHLPCARAYVRTEVVALWKWKISTVEPCKELLGRPGRRALARHVPVNMAQHQMVAATTPARAAR